MNLLDTYTPSYVSIDKEKILDINKLFNYLKFNILNKSINELKNTFFAEEGLENKLYEIIKYNNFDDFISYLTTKRYTSSRIRRLLFYVLFNISKDNANSILSSKLDYIRVLGFNQKGKEYLSSIKKDTKIYTNIKNNLNPILDIELKISKILDIIYNTTIFTQEQQKPVIL
jgi:predicted nucleotidyltransferase